jgi:hypothetical protein
MKKIDGGTGFSPVRATCKVACENFPILTGVRQ